MWTINIRIREAANLSNGNVITIDHRPDFEAHYLNEQPKKDKPYNIFYHLTSDGFFTEDKYIKLRECLSEIESGTHLGLYHSCQDIELWA